MAVKTNGDFVRSMNNEELARWLSDNSLSDSVRDWLSWLNRPFGCRGPWRTLPEVYKIRLMLWAFQNRSMFADARESESCYGKIDDAYIYVTNKAFKLFCIAHQYDPLDVLRVLSNAGYIVDRIGSFHGGYYKTSRICRNVKSCVWLIKDDFYNELEDCYRE